MPRTPRHRPGLMASTALVVGLLSSAGAAQAAPLFNLVAAGDMTATDAILLTRVDNGGSALGLTAQVATDRDFQNVVWSATGTTVPTNDYTLKFDATGLRSNTQYYYRFNGAGASSATGQFTTTPAPNQAVAYKVGFSGDSDGRFRPFPSFAGFGTSASPGTKGLNSFIFLGDTMYETASTGSPGVVQLTPLSTPAQAQAVLPVYNQKYLEVVSGVNGATGAIATSAGQQGLKDMFQSVGQYSLLDNHELGNRQLQSGGAPLAASSPNANPAFDVNATGSYNNQTVAFQTLEKSFFNYHPTAADVQGTPTTGLTLTNLQLPNNTVAAPADPRSNGTLQTYFARSWGANANYIQLDDRSYRDVRLDVQNSGSGSSRADNPQRTMLGSTQLAWFKSQIDAAKASGATWTVIALSTPIDQTGGNQDSKSWFGNYSAERNELLKYVADSGLKHVVFLTTDDHQMRTTQLQYQPDPVNQPNLWALLPGAFQIVSGPIGAGGPDGITDHSFANIQALLNTATTVPDNNPDLIAHNQPVIGLAGFAGLSNVFRQGDPNAAARPSSIDFYAPDKFGYTTLAFDQFGNLRVETWGIDSYQQNVFPQTAPDPSLIMAFSIDVPEPASMAVLGTGLLGLTLLRGRSKR